MSYKNGDGFTYRSEVFLSGSKRSLDDFKVEGRIRGLHLTSKIKNEDSGVMSERAGEG